MSNTSSTRIDASSKFADLPNLLLNEESIPPVAQLDLYVEVDLLTWALFEKSSSGKRETYRFQANRTAVDPGVHKPMATRPISRK